MSRNARNLDRVFSRFLFKTTRTYSIRIPNLFFGNFGPIKTPISYRTILSFGFIAVIPSTLFLSPTITSSSYAEELTTTSLIYATLLTSSTDGYDTPSNPQYHIQTDEGPERYFRYQTLSGQFRKEKRLEDGTVIGTYAWIDDDGILRQRDYIADHAGYRITKSKNLYVGRNVPVADAIKTAKKYPASAGTLVSAKARPVSVRPSISTIGYTPSPHGMSSTPLPPISSPSTPCASCVVSSTTYKPEIGQISPHVEISNNALPASITLLSTTEKPYVEINPGGVSGLLASTVSSTIAPDLTPSTGLPLEYLKTNVQDINNLQYHETSTTAPYRGYDGLPSYTEAGQNSLEYNPYVNPLGQNVFFQNGPTYPIDRNGHTYRGTKRYTSSARIGNGYDKQFPEYDGVSVTNDGFRYYIPRAYHEEETGPGEERTGSFGYIDPFGIRRVVYYNAKPGEGFQHRKNNRYVGFRATPYDPNPY
ncbi:uncharacterized protein [Euwallacea fornicatus]|uniref:uncharacterized protein isoform X2 n=1 Tax=Euwallacea fornicatus TaxID=995702 RepID=UPI00338D662A